VLDLFPVLDQGSAAVTGEMVGMPRDFVLLPLPVERSAVRTPLSLLLLPDSNNVSIFSQPVRFVVCYDPSAKDRRGDSVSAGVVDSPTELDVVSVTLSDKGRDDGLPFTSQAASKRSARAPSCN
jgi:hypothetical protein